MEIVSWFKDICCFLATLVLLINSFSMTQTLDKQEFIMNKLANCKGLTNDTMLWKDFILDRDPTTKDFVFSLTVKILRELSTKFTLEFTLSKCDSDGSACETIFNKVKISDTCKVLFKKGQLWTRFMESFEKPLNKCPIEPGEYQVKKCPIQKNFLKIIPLRGAMFRATIRGFDNGLLVSCADAEMKFNRKTHSG